VEVHTEKSQANDEIQHHAVVTLVAIAATRAASATPIPTLVNFDPPTTAQGPSIYVAVPHSQTIVTTPATFSGGVVLGFATFFPAISFATVPNVYGTADFGNGLSESLSIAIDPTFFTNEVSFALFNGETFNQSYSVNAFNGASLVASQTLTSVSPNFNSGYGLIDLNSALGITNVTITPDGIPSFWDYLIDTVAFNQSITTSVNTPAPPSTPLPPTPPVQGHGHGKGNGETELVEVNFGDDVNDIRGSVLPVTPLVDPPAPVPAQTPEPASYMLALTGMGFIAVARKLKAA
jgi:hypothetical protein